jgi:hypothetical protein
VLGDRDGGSVAGERDGGSVAGDNVGSVLGDCVGGSVVGAIDGRAVVGIGVGSLVGIGVGEVDGSEDGLCVGYFVGLAVVGEKLGGRVVGDAVVGERVGLSVGGFTHVPPQLLVVHELEPAMQPREVPSQAELQPKFTSYVPYGAYM